MKFYAIGGYNEVGKNMSAVEVNGDVVILDMGIHLDKIITMEEEQRLSSTKKLIDAGALPNDSILEKKNVQAIILSHAHLDHAGATHRLAERYDCPIIGTPFTLEVVKRLLKDEKKSFLIKNLHTVNVGETVPISSNFEAEFINMTHSTPQTSLIALHTKEGVVTYLNDYKLDNNPTLGQSPDYKRIKQLGKQGVKLHVSECVRVEELSRTPSEYVAKIMVRDAIERAYEDNTGVVITTFASHIARLRSIIEANKNRRKIIMFGRSLFDYVTAANELGLINIEGITIHKKRKVIARELDVVKTNPNDYLIIATGNQGEPNSVLSRIGRKEFKFRFRKEDQVIFSSDIIPNPLNRANRYILERNLKEQSVRVFENVHVSGHAQREDHRDVLRMLSPEYVLPNHGETERLASYAALAMEEGYRMGDTVRILYNGAVVEIN